MAFIRWIFTLVVIIAILGFSLQNMELVDVHILKWQSGEIPLYWVMFGSFALAAIFFFITMFFYTIQHKREVGRCKSQIKKLQAELDKLRVVSVEEGLSEVEDEFPDERDQGDRA